MKWWKGLGLGKKIGIILLGIFVVAAAGGGTQKSQSNLSTSNSNAAGSSSLDVSKQQPIETVETKTETKVEPVPYESTTKNDATLSSGTTKITTTGVDGERTTIFKVTYKNGKETGREQVSSEITKPPVTEVTSIGTKTASSNCDPNYSPCIPNVSYDLDCADIGFTVRVIGSDRHRLDRDKDGYGCE